ncbi:MAG: metalloregulator ArsR/SmtB family transcription factor, partial [Ignavibacteriaceae bacterium]
LRILKMLQIRSLCVCEITEVLQLATSTVSKHLSILKDSDFIMEEKSGKWVNYMIKTNPSDQRVSSLLSRLDFWISDEAVISKDRILVNKVDRNILCSK